MKQPLLLPMLSMALLISGCSKKNEFQAPPAPEVAVQKPAQKTVTVFDAFPGRLEAHDTVEIRARVKGFLKTIDFEDGQRVEKGDLLFTIEPEQYIAAAQTAKAGVAQAQASLQLADATLLRTENAFKTKSVSEVDVLTAKANKQSAEAAVQSAEASLDAAELNLSYTKIHAPISGRMGRRMLSVGNVVGSAGSSLLSTLVVEAPIDILFNVDERTLLPHLNRGVRASKPASTPPVKLELATGDLHDEEGTINYIDPEVDPETGTLQARAVFANKDIKLLPGLYGKVLLPETIENAVLVPDRVVQRDMSGYFVLLVNNENQVESRYIKRGRIVDGKRIITEGLTVEDRIIVKGIQRARPGITVRVAEPKAAQ